jgi:hypothetical protein
MISAQGTGVQQRNVVSVKQLVNKVLMETISRRELYGQGFQQSVWVTISKNNINNLITTIVYQIPFRYNLNFNSHVIETISLALFDVRGRLVYSAEKKLLIF